MIAKELKKYTNNINFTHLYSKKMKLISITKYGEDFQNYESFDLSDKSLDLSLCEVIFIEIEKLDKQNIKILSDIVKNNSSKSIHIFATDYENNFLLKFALHFSLNKIEPLVDDKDEIDKILLIVFKKYSSKKEEQQQVTISKKVNSFFALLVFEKERLVFANEKAKQLFNSTKLSIIKNTVENTKEINSLIISNKNDNGKVIVKDENGEEQIYDFFLGSFSNTNDRLLTIVPENKMLIKDSVLLTISRFEFTEILKDKLAQNSINEASMTLMLINISNYDKITKANKGIVVHTFIKKFIQKLSLYKESYQDLVQWNSNFFLFLAEGDSFSKVKNTLENIHQKLIYDDIDKLILPTITSFALSIDRLEINDIIDSIEQISNHSFTCKDFNTDDFFEINHFDNYINEDEQIHHYLQSCVSNKTPIKLLNIYKGLCINTQSRLIKISDNSYFIECENLQGYSMQFENKTILQSPDLPRDIRADIVYVNIEKSYAVLDNLVFLNASANNRQHTRVQPNFRTPIIIKYGKYSYQGEIMDLSTQAIAIKLNSSLNAKLASSIIDLNFKLPDSSSEDGFNIMLINGKIVYMEEIDKAKSKVVVSINLEKPFDSYLLKYMYERQKELIIELRKLKK